jgi:hypothetical protein
MTAAEKAAFKEDNSGRVADYLGAMEKGIKEDTYLNLYESFYNLEKRKDIDTTRKAQEWAKIVGKAREARKINGTQRDWLRDNLTFRYSMEAETEKFDEMVESGISSQKAFDVGVLLRGIEGTGKLDEETGKRKVTDADKWGAIADIDYLTDEEKDNVIKLYMPDYDAEDDQPDKTELKYDYIRQELGYSAAEYVELYRAHLDNDKKNDKIDAWMGLGYSRSEANLLYRLYGATGNNKIDVVQWHNGQ